MHPLQRSELTEHLHTELDQLIFFSGVISPSLGQQAHPQVEPSNEQILRLPVTVFIKHRHSQNHNYLGYKRSKKAI